ncbi:DUF1365 domain-containing protein [Cognatishimia sp. SS12]|uniref:DUF1365 domain-containing protein n=1 Tax=Cognatishimia sp. SS12 TaxID=2979465 RepID=UPI003FA4454E
MGPQHIPARTTHSRKGALTRSFTYSVDYVLIDPNAAQFPLLFGRNRANLVGVSDRNHGGPRGNGTGAAWAEQVLATAGLPDAKVLLLTQPSFLGYVFNPISFWLAYQDGALRAVIAEVNNTFGDRHSYLCHAPDFADITPDMTLTAKKQMHVSPFQEVAGEYSFKFSILDEKIRIQIIHYNGAETLYAHLTGPRRPLNNRAILGALLRRPLGPVRTIALIYWQALKLKRQGARYRTRPTPPKKDLS